MLMMSQNIQSETIVICGWCKKSFRFKNCATHKCLIGTGSDKLHIETWKQPHVVYPCDKDLRTLWMDPATYADYAEEPPWERLNMKVDDQPATAATTSRNSINMNSDEEFTHIQISDDESDSPFIVKLSKKKLREVTKDQPAWEAFIVKLRQAKQGKENARKRKLIDDVQPQSSNPNSSSTPNCSEIQSMDHETFQAIKMKLRKGQIGTNTQAIRESNPGSANNQKYAQNILKEQSSNTKKKPSVINPTNSCLPSTSSQSMSTRHFKNNNPSLNCSAPEQESDDDDKFTWTKPMILLMLHEYADQLKLCGKSSYARTSCWKKVGSKMKSYGYSDCDDERCRKKFQYLKSQYNKTNDHNSTSGNDRKDFEYHAELSNILSSDVSVKPKLVVSSDKFSSDESESELMERFKSKKLKKTSQAKKNKTAVDYLADLVEEKRITREHKQVQAERKLIAAEKLTDLLGEFLKKKD